MNKFHRQPATHVRYLGYRLHISLVLARNLLESLIRLIYEGPV